VQLQGWQMCQGLWLLCCPVVRCALTRLWTQTLRTPGTRQRRAAACAALLAAFAAEAVVAACAAVLAHLPGCVLLCYLRRVGHAGVDLAVDANNADAWNDPK
jgi:hypothetical protein